MHRDTDKEHHEAHHDHHDEHHEHEREHQRGFSLMKWMRGFAWGIMAGYAVSTLWAPRPGRDTQELIRYKGVQLKQMAGQVSQEARERAQQLRADAGLKVQSLRQQGSELVQEQRGRVTRVAEAVKTAAQENWRPGNGQPDSEPGSMGSQMPSSEYTGPTGGTRQY